MTRCVTASVYPHPPLPGGSGLFWLTGPADVTPSVPGPFVQTPVTGAGAFVGVPDVTFLPDFVRLPFVGRHQRFDRRRDGLVPRTWLEPPTRGRPTPVPTLRSTARQRVATTHSGFPDTTNGRWDFPTPGFYPGKTAGTGSFCGYTPPHRVHTGGALNTLPTKLTILGSARFGERDADRTSASPTRSYLTLDGATPTIKTLDDTRWLRQYAVRVGYWLRLDGRVPPRRVCLPHRYRRAPTTLPAAHPTTAAYLPGGGYLVIATAPFVRRLPHARGPSLLVWTPATHAYRLPHLQRVLCFLVRWFSLVRAVPAPNIPTHNAYGTTTPDAGWA